MSSKLGNPGMAIWGPPFLYMYLHKHCAPGCTFMVHNYGDPHVKRDGPFCKILITLRVNTYLHACHAFVTISVSQTNENQNSGWHMCAKICVKAQIVIRRKKEHNLLQVKQFMLVRGSGTRISDDK